MTRLTPGGVHREPLEVAADGDHVEQHPLQGRGDGELAERFGQLPAADAQALGPGGEVAAHRVHPRVQARRRPARARRRPPREQLGLGRGARAAARGPGSRRRGWTRSPRTALPVRRRAGAAGRVGVVHELAEHAVVDQDVAAGGQALAVGLGGGEGTRVGRVVDEGDERRATSSPSRSANSERPLSTASPESVEPMMPRNWAVTQGSRTTVTRSVARLGRRRAGGWPGRRRRRRHWRRRARRGPGPTENPKPVWVSSPSSASA